MNEEKRENLFVEVIRLFQEQRVSVHAAQVAFFILASLIPFLMFLVTLLHYTPLTEDFALSTLKTFIPSGLHSFIDSIIAESSLAASGTLLSVTVIGALWAGSKGFIGIAFEFDNIYEVEEPRNYFIYRFQAILYTIAFTVIIIAGLIFLVYGNQIVIFLTKNLPFSLEFSIFGVGFGLRSIFYYLILTIFFLCLYRYVPKRTSTFSREIPGAILTSFLWVIFSYLYSLYIDSYGNSLSLYGSLTSLILLMIWLYFCINIIFIGSVLNKYLADSAEQGKKINLRASILHFPKDLWKYLRKSTK